MVPEAAPFICDFSRFGRDFAGSIDISAKSALSFVTSAGTRVDLGQLSTVWWRRPQNFLKHSTNDTAVGGYVYEENFRFWESALALLSSDPTIVWYNDFDANRRADRKAYQLSLASQAGFRVPRTIVTSCQKTARDFVGEVAGEVIFKSFAGSEAFWQPTRRLTEPMLDDLQGLHLCPVIFQEFIEGRWDYRVTVIDDFVQAVRFDVGSGRYKYDVRIDTKNRCESCKLEIGVEQRIINFVHLLGLRYASIDFRESKTGDLVFFEVNPAGQFLYLDLLAGTDICSVMAAALSKPKSSSDVVVEEAESHAWIFKYEESGRPFAERVRERVTHLE